MFRHVPNLLTVSRAVLAVIFFALLAFYQYDGRGDPTLLNVAFGVYVVALATDILDGYLARRWKVEGAFGRIVDPFVDKILVLGSFIFFAGKNFIIPETADPTLKGQAFFVVRTITGVAPGMVVILLARELLVTSFRAISEGEGKAFGADWSGKLKMALQSVTILLILVYVNYHPWLARHPKIDSVAIIARDIAIWTTIAVTVLSGVHYVLRMLAARKSSPTVR